MPWRPASFRGKKVWVEVDHLGKLMAEGGRVPMRYSDKAGVKIYRAGVANLKVEARGTVDLPPGISADAGGGKGGRSKGGSGFGSAGKRTEAQAAAAAVHGRKLVEGFSRHAAIAFTDGACSGNPGPCGAGAVLRLPDGTRSETYSALGRGTNNVGELAAIGLALDLLEQTAHADDAPLEILTDSKYSHGVLSLGWKAKKNTELIVGLRKRLALRRHRIHWIAGHVGIDDNERADALARKGVEESR